MTVTSDNLRAKRPLNPRTTAEANQAEARFEALFLEHYPRVYGVLFRLLGDRAEAEDLAVETFWRLYKQPPRRRENLAGWLYRVATNLGLNSIRAWKRRRQHEEQAGRLELSGQASEGPETLVERREEKRRVRRILEKIQPRYAQLLSLRHSGLSYQEIAEALGVAPGSVGTLLARAEKEFERVYAQEEKAHAP